MPALVRAGGGREAAILHPGDVVAVVAVKEGLELCLPPELGVEEAVDALKDDALGLRQPVREEARDRAEAGERVEQAEVDRVEDDWGEVADDEIADPIRLRRHTESPATVLEREHLAAVHPCHRAPTVREVEHEEEHHDHHHGPGAVVEEHGAVGLLRARHARVCRVDPIAVVRLPRREREVRLPKRAEDDARRRHPDRARLEQSAAAEAVDGPDARERRREVHDAVDRVEQVGRQAHEAEDRRAVVHECVHPDELLEQLHHDADGEEAEDAPGAELGPPRAPRRLLSYQGGVSRSPSIYFDSGRAT
eukprot:gene3838-biopygen6989